MNAGTVTTGNNAFYDIISGDRYKGAISSIGWLVSIVDKFFIAIISFCGFFIISIVFLKSALVCLYASYPKLFNKIHESKMAMHEMKGNGPQGLLVWGLSLFIPDIKEIADVPDDMEGGGYVDMKSLIFKTVASGAVLTIVGTMVYNGYYRDLMGMLSNVGSHVFETYIYTIDLNSALDNALEAGSDYEFNYGATKQGEAKGALAEEVYKTVKNYYTRDYLNSTDDRWVVGQDIESWMNREVFQTPTTLGIKVGDALGSDDYTVKYSVAVVQAITQNEDATATGDKSTWFGTVYGNVKTELTPTFQPAGLSEVKDGFVRISLLISPTTSNSGAAQIASKMQPTLTGSYNETNDSVHIQIPKFTDSKSLQFNSVTIGGFVPSVNDNMGSTNYFDVTLSGAKVDAIKGQTLEVRNSLTTSTGADLYGIGVPITKIKITGSKDDSFSDYTLSVEGGKSWKAGEASLQDAVLQIKQAYNETRNGNGSNTESDKENKKDNPGGDGDEDDENENSGGDGH